MEIAALILLGVVIAQVQYLILRGRSLPQSFKRSSGVFIDTSALMDGRILTIAQTGFIPRQLLVPKSVLAELQMLADQADSDKRMRARHGLDVVEELRSMKNVNVEIYDDKKLEGDVDDRLLLLAERYQASICTTDFNLNKVAKANGLIVLNVNELAQSIRLAFLPGESVSIVLQQKGQDSHQGVGYLADGTMVVVERAAEKIGQSVEIEFIRSLQTAAGRMMFARLIGAESGKGRTTSSKTTERHQTKGSHDSKPKSGHGRAPRASADKPAANTSATPKPRRSSRNKEDDLIDLLNSQ